jgi:cytochrome P450
VVWTLFLVRDKSEQFFLGSGGKDKLFLNNLLSVEAESAKLSETDVLDEMHTILCAGTETIALTVGLLLSMMGLYPTIQVGVFSNIIKDLLLSFFPHRKLSKRNLTRYLVVAREMSL